MILLAFFFPFLVCLEGDFFVYEFLTGLLGIYGIFGKIGGIWGFKGSGSIYSGFLKIFFKKI